MKQLLLLLSFVFCASISAQEIKWMSMDEAIQAQQKKPKKIFVDMYTVWCGPCKLYDKRTFSNKDVATYINKNFYPVKFNAEGNETVTLSSQKFTNPNYQPARAFGRNSRHQFARYMNVTAYPTVLFIDSDGELITALKGYRSPKQLEPFLKLYGTDLWKTVNTQEKFDQYYSNFDYEFKTE